MQHLPEGAGFDWLGNTAGNSVDRLPNHIDLVMRDAFYRQTIAATGIDPQANRAAYDVLAIDPFCGPHILPALVVAEHATVATPALFAQFRPAVIRTPGSTVPIALGQKRTKRSRRGGTGKATANHPRRTA